MKAQLNLHLMSDSTGETLTFIAKAVLSQFPDVTFKIFQYFLINTSQKLEKHFQDIIQNPGIVLYTILNSEEEKTLAEMCKQHNILCIPAISPIINKFADYLGIKEIKTVGRQHQISDEYYRKMEAINYTIAHDDGNLQEDLSDADIIILGVSRSSKSPTSIYLAYKGYKVSNIPFISQDLIPEYIKTLKKPLIVGFTIDPERLKSIRTTRIRILDSGKDTNYTDIAEIKAEVAEAKSFFSKLNIPVINVTAKSIEETSVYVIDLLNKHLKSIF